MQYFSSSKRLESISACNVSVIVKISTQHTAIINMSRLYKDCFIVFSFHDVLQYHGDKCFRCSITTHIVFEMNKMFLFGF